MVIFSLIFKYAFWRICHIRSFWPTRNQCFKNAYSIEWDNDMIAACVSRLHYFPRTSKGLLNTKKIMCGAVVVEMDNVSLNWHFPNEWSWPWKSWRTRLRHTQIRRHVFYSTQLSPLWPPWSSHVRLQKSPSTYPYLLVLSSPPCCC